MFAYHVTDIDSATFGKQFGSMPLSSDSFIVPPCLYIYIKEIISAKQKQEQNKNPIIQFFFTSLTMISNIIEIT